MRSGEKLRSGEGAEPGCHGASAAGYLQRLGTHKGWVSVLEWEGSTGEHRVLRELRLPGSSRQSWARCSSLRERLSFPHHLPGEGSE